MKEAAMTLAFVARECIGVFAGASCDSKSSDLYGRWRATHASNG
jgi:hypothetical protein